LEAAAAADADEGCGRPTRRLAEAGRRARAPRNPVPNAAADDDDDDDRGKPVAVGVMDKPSSSALASAVVR
jgi:hypothetical protein